MAEKLDADKTKQLIERFMHNIMQDDSSYYYAPTIEVARAIHEKIQADMNQCLVEEQKLLQPLSVEDIQIILSLH